MGSAANVSQQLSGAISMSKAMGLPRPLQKWLASVKNDD
jgi:hypothetical protein